MITPFVRHSLGLLAATALMVTAAPGCGGAKAGTVQVTNDTGSTVSVVECFAGLGGLGCGDAVGRQQLRPGHTANFASRPCSEEPCRVGDVVVYGYQGSTRCAAVPPPDGKHSFLFLVTTLPISGCGQYEPLTR